MAEDAETPSAESSPAQPEQSKQADFTIPTDPEAYAHWRQTGELPDEKETPSKREAPAPSKPSVDEESEKGAPVSETGKHGRNYEGRIKELVSKEKQTATERDAYRAKLEALEAGKKDASVDSSPAPAKNVPADSSTAPESPQRPVKPKQDSFDSWEAFETAQDKYIEDLAAFKAKQQLAEYLDTQYREARHREMNVRLDEAEQRYGAEAKKKIMETAHAVFDDQQLSKDLKTAMARSKVLPDALYVMGSDEKEFSAFRELAQRDPLEALRKWFTVEDLVKEELGTSGKSEAAPARGPDGKFLPPNKPARKLAPAPPVELNGNSSPPGDISERAANSDNVVRFFEERNRKDLLRYKGLG